MKEGEREWDAEWCDLSSKDKKPGTYVRRNGLSAVRQMQIIPKLISTQAQKVVRACVQVMSGLFCMALT